ncbi:MAG TPA: hypothetical protein VMS18_05490 [Candidatus Binatia bacterium]|nr:hypothetical protein [Candidatus Binatia bacterium]
MRFRLVMVPAVFEKFSFAASQTVLYLQHRLHPSNMVLGGIDGLLGVLFLLAFIMPPTNICGPKPDVH